ncbi:Werner syndrome ATP-dependent helicase-like, partial [Durusdinium trenchii]
MKCEFQRYEIVSLIAGFNQSKWGFSCEGLQLLDAKVLSVGCRPGRFSGAYRKMERHAVHEESGTLLEYDLASEKAAFEGAFSVLRFREQCDAVDLPLLVGLDFEWKPDKAGSDNPIALMQFACWDTVLLLRTVGAAELPGWLRAFLESGEEILKVVASFDLADKRKLKNSFGWDFEEQAVKASYWDIAELAGAQGLPQGMLKMAQYFELPLQKLKSVGTSNWSAELTLEQRRYAADDAFFQLYLLGRLLPSARSDSRSMQASWSAIREELERNIKKVDNSKYKANFMALRAVLLDAVHQLSRALGAGGCTDLNQLKQFQAIQVALAQQTGPVVQLNAQFLRQNSDLVVCFYRDGRLHVRVRSEGSDSEDQEEEVLETEELILKVQELLVAYKPPIGKKPSALREVLWETSYDSEDGLLLRLARHPRAPDDHKHLELSVHSLSELSQIDPAEAKSRLTADEKFMHLDLKSG